MGIFSSIIKGITGLLGDIIGFLIGVDFDDFDDQAQGALVNKQSNIDPIPVVYGRRKVGGVRVFVSSGGGKKNKYLYMAVVLSEGEIQAIDQIYINDKLHTHSDYSGLIQVDKKLGTDGQLASSVLIGSGGDTPDDNWGSNHRLRGVAYLAIRIKYDADVFGGIPEIQCVIRGRKVYDPRTGLTAYSNNPALCLRDYLTNTRYGKGLPASAINDTMFGAAATYYDTTSVTSYTGGGSIKQFECNARLDTGKTVFDNVKELLQGMRGLLPYSDGQYGLIVDKAETLGSNTFDLSPDNILSKITVTDAGKGKRYNRVIAKFPNPAANWQMDSVTYPVKSTDPNSDFLTFLDEDNGEELVREINLNTITNLYQARDMARVVCEASRRNTRAVTLTATSEAMDVAVGDVVRLEHPSLGWTGSAIQAMRVVSTRIKDNGEVDLQLIEYNDVYSWSVLDEELDQPNTTLPNPFDIALPGTPGATEITALGPDGTVQPAVALSWTEANDAFVSDYEVQWRLTSDADFTNFARTSETSIDLFGLDVGSEYTFQVRSINALGVHSDFTSTTTTLQGDQTAPGSVTLDAITGGIRGITVEWTNPTDSDYAFTEVHVVDANTTPGVSAAPFAKVAGEEYFYPTGSGVTTKYFFLRAVDFSGNKGAYTGTTNNSGSSLRATEDDIGDNQVTITKIADTLQSTNYVAATSGWKLTTDGTFEAGDGTFRGAITATSGSIANTVTIGGTAASTVESGAASGATALQNGDDITDGTVGGVTITSTKLYQGTGTFNNSNTGFYLDSSGQFSLKDKLSFNGTTLSVSGAITATSLTLSGTSIAESQLATGVQDSLGLADSAVQDGDTGVNLGLDDGSIAGISINSTKLYAGTGTWANSNTGFYLDNTGKFSLKDKFFYNPSNNLLTVDGNITADVITAKENLVVLGDLEASSMAAGSITRAMFSQDALDEIYGALATSVGGSNGDYKEASGSFTTSGGTVTVGTSSDKFDHGTSDVVVEFLANHYFYTTTNYTTAQAQATLNFEVSADGTFTDLTSATKTQTLQFVEYDLTSYYGYTYLVYYFNGEHSKTFTTGSGNDIPDSTELQFRVRVTGVGTAFTSQTVPFTVEANEGVTGVVSTGGNADTLDNLDSTKFLRSDVDDTFDANLTITGNLTVNGTQTTLNTATLQVEDKNIVLNYGTGDTSGSADGAGITIQDAVNSSTDATILWNATTDKFDFSHGIDVTGATTLDGYVYVNVAGNNLVLQSDSVQRETIQWTQNNVNRWKLNLQADGDLDFVPADTADKLLYNNNEIATQSWVTSQGYATSFSETDTLATVTGRGASTSNDITLTGDLILDPTGDDSLRFVADNDAYQRADARNDDTNYARVHWYGKENDLSTSNFRHAWYDGDSYVNVTAENNGVTFGGGVKSTSTVEAVYLRATSTGDAGASSTTHGLQVGPTSGGNVIIDDNEVMARNNGSTSELNLNPDGGNVTFRANSAGTTNLTMSGAVFLDQSRNATLNNISSGQITSSGSITAGNASTSLGYYVGSTQVIQGSTRNLVNIGTINSGAIQSSSSIDSTNVTTGTFRVYDGTTFRGGLGTGQWATGQSAQVGNFSLFATGTLNFHANGAATPVATLTTSGFNITAAITSTSNLTARTGTFSGQNGTALSVNSGTTNVAAKFESTDDEVWINLKDNNSGTYGALLGHADDALFKVADNSVNVRMSLSGAGLLDTDAGFSVAGTTVINSSGGGVFSADTSITGGRLTINDNSNQLRIRSQSNGVGVNINFSDHSADSFVQNGDIKYVHSNTESYGSGHAFILTGTESTMTILADGKLMFKEGLYLKPSSGTGAGTQIIDSSRNLTIVNATVSGISNHQRDVRSARQVRAAGWYNESASTNYTGLAFEIGQSGGTCFALAYNRATNSYGPMAFSATSFKFNNHVQFGDGTQSNASDANITINKGNAFAGIDLKSTRTSGNIGGIRSYNSVNSITNQLLFRVDGYVNLLNSNGFAINNVIRIDGDGDATFRELTTSSLVKLTASSGFNQYTENGAYINWDVRDSGSTARVHNWARNTTNSGYEPYYENWYDGSNYYSIGIDGGAWRISGNAFISGALSVGGNFSTRSGYLMHAKSTGPCRLLLEADSDNVTETDTVQIRMEQDGSAVNARMGFTANNDFEIVNEYASYFYLGGNNNYRFRLDNSGNVIVNGNVTAYGSASDQRLKSDIKVIPDALEKVMTLDGVTFNYIGEEERMTGLIAQQVEAVLPEAVYETSSIEDDETAYKALHYGNIVGLTVEAIKELKRENDELKDLVKQLMHKLEK